MPELKLAKLPDRMPVKLTITVRPGWPLRVIVEKDLVLRPYRG
jgi:type IV secretion system protein VirB10